MTDSNNSINGLQLSNNTYNNMKFFVQIVLPALGVLYISLSGLWGFPHAKEVSGTISAVALFLGVILRISSANYSAPLQAGTPEPDGSFVIKQDIEGKKIVTLNLDKDPEEVIGKDQIVFKVQRSDS